MSLPLHSLIRRAVRDWFNRLLQRWLSVPATHEQIERRRIHTVLIIRLNYRIGNILFTTPLINALSHDLPHAKVDMLIGAQITVPILEGMSNVDRVMVFERSLLYRPWALWRFIRSFRHYDLVINLNTASMSDKIATLLARSSYTIGFLQPNAWAPLSHPIASWDEPRPHAALQPLKLMEFFKDASGDYVRHLSMRLTVQERLQGQTILASYVPKDVMCIGIFRDARHEKKIDTSWWQEWYHALSAHMGRRLRVIDILSPEVSVPLNEDVIPYQNKNLRILGAVLANLDLFVCGDTGPMHLAGAAEVPTIALFKTTNPTIFGAIGLHDESIILSTTTPQKVAYQMAQYLLKEKL